AKQLGINKPFMYQRVETVGKIMVDHYPEVTEEQSLIERIIKKEEERFHEKRNEGCEMMATKLEKEKKKGKTGFSIEEADKVYEIIGKMMFNKKQEVSEEESIIELINKKEEEGFHEKLNDGLEMVATILEKEKEKGNAVFPGEEVFKLYDTYGFPKELTEEYVGEHGFTIDEDGFQKEMEKQRERARDARQQVDSMQVQEDLLSEINARSKFIGYNKGKV